MAHRILRAAVASLAAARALAEANIDDVSLVQREVQSASAAIDMARVENGLMGVFTGMLSAIQLENTIHELGEVASAASAKTGQCSAADRERIKTNTDLLSARLEKEGAEQVKRSMPPVCQKLLSGGIPGFADMDSCEEKLFGIPPQCAKCSSGLLKDLTGLDFKHMGGCMVACMPITSACQAGQTAPSQACNKAATKCLKCGHPAYKRYSECMGGHPQQVDELKAADQMYDDFVEGKVGLNDGLQKLMMKIDKLHKH